MTTPANLLYPLKLDVVGFKEDEYDYHFRVELAEPTCCQACGAAEGRVVRFGKDDQAYRDVPIHGKRSTIWMIRRRYKCHDCGSTFRPELKDMDDRRMMTKRLLKHIEVKACLGSNSDVARDVGVDEKTVRSIFMDYYKAKDAEYKLTVPRVLGVDELYLGKEYVAIFTNITERTVVEMLPNRTLSTLNRFFANLPARKDVEVVCSDMYGPYRTLTKTMMPQATQVIDKFHVIKMANETLEVIRRSLKAELTAKQRKTLLGDRKLLLMREHDLKPLQHVTMETWLNAFPELGMAYRLKEGFYGIYDATCEKDAKERFIKWKADIPSSQQEQWGAVAKTVTNWSEGIFAYFKPGHQYTNALTESQNRGAKDKQRDARGMEFETYRAKVLFSQEHKIVKPKPRRQSPFEGFGRVFMNYDLEDAATDYGVPISTVMRLIEMGEL